MLPKIMKSSTYMFKKNPCLNCIVRSCCKTKCDLLDQWKRRFDLIKMPFILTYYTFMIIIVSLILVIFMVLFGILWSVGYKDLDRILQEEVRY